MMRVRAWLRLKTGWIPRPVRRAIVLVIGGTLLIYALLGMLLPILPGFVFLPLALAILALEFAWAARWLKRLRKTAGSVQQRVRNGWWWGGPGPESANREARAKTTAHQPIVPAGSSKPPPKSARAA